MLLFRPENIHHASIPLFSYKYAWHSQGRTVRFAREGGKKFAREARGKKISPSLEEFPIPGPMN